VEHIIGPWYGDLPGLPYGGANYLPAGTSNTGAPPSRSYARTSSVFRSAGPASACRRAAESAIEWGQLRAPGTCNTNAFLCYYLLNEYQGTLVAP